MKNLKCLCKFRRLYLSILSIFINHLVLVTFYDNVCHGFTKLQQISKENFLLSLNFYPPKNPPVICLPCYIICWVPRWTTTIIVLCISHQQTKIQIISINMASQIVWNICHLVNSLSSLVCMRLNRTFMEKLHFTKAPKGMDNSVWHNY